MKIRLTESEENGYGLIWVSPDLDPVRCRRDYADCFNSVTFDTTFSINLQRQVSS